MKCLADLVESFQLYAVCADCQRMEHVPLPALIERCGAATPIDEVRDRLRCRACGRRTGDVRIVYVGKSAALSGFHYRGNPEPGARPPSQPFSSSVDSRVSPNPSTPT